MNIYQDVISKLVFSKLLESLSLNELIDYLIILDVGVQAIRLITASQYWSTQLHRIKQRLNGFDCWQ